MKMYSEDDFGLALFTPQGFTGAILQLVGHAFAKCALFMTAGIFILLTAVRVISPSFAAQLEDEIESVLIAHPSVLECAVTGAPDPIRGQVVKATIVLAKGYTPSEELKKELQTYVKKNTAPYKYPRIVECVDELPKTISGKIRRVQIRNEDNKKNS